MNMIVTAHAPDRTGYVRNNDRGLTLIELMIASTIAVVATAGMGMIYQSQQGEFERQKMVSDLDETGRLAVNHMGKRIRLARVGSNPTSALLTACACQISFDSNWRGVYTFLPTVSGVTTTISVTSTAGFAIGDNVSLTSWTVTPNWQARTITAIGPGPTLTLNSSLPNILPPGPQQGFPQGSGIFKTFTTTFALDLVQKRLLEGSRALTTNVLMAANNTGYPPNGVALFRYFNQGNDELVPLKGATCLTSCLRTGPLPTQDERSMVREVLISLPLESPRPTNPMTKQKSTVLYQTGVKLRLPSPS